MGLKGFSIKYEVSIHGGVFFFPMGFWMAHPVDTALKQNGRSQKCWLDDDFMPILNVGIPCWKKTHALPVLSN